MEPGAYQLEARIPAWQITLSWQAFHERLPRSHSHTTEVQAKNEAPATLVRRSLRLAKRVARKLLSLAKTQ